MKKKEVVIRCQQVASFTRSEIKTKFLSTVRKGLHQVRNKGSMDCHRMRLLQPMR